VEQLIQVNSQAPLHTVFLGLGTNLGDRLANLQAGLRALSQDVDIIAVSGLYETDPVGVTDQPPFYNAACSARTALDPEPLLDRAKEAERSLGREPGPRWGPRPLDIDILLYDSELVETPRLRIPHERLAERGFVLRPLADLDPCLVVPGLELSVADLLVKAGSEGVRHIAGPGWECSGGGLL